MPRALPLVCLLAACTGEIQLPTPHVNGGTGAGGTGAGGTGAGMTGTGGGNTEPQPEVLPDFVPAPLQGHVLLSWQYVNTIRDVLGADAAALVRPPKDLALNGLSAIGAGTVSISTVSVNDYETSAYAAAAKALDTAAKRQALYGCTPTAATDDVCFGKFLSSVGKRLYRRPIETDEITRWKTVHREAAMAYSSFDKGAEFVLAGLLMSPSFLYRFEVGTPDPADPTRQKLTPYELAARLSFFIAGTTPSDTLLAAAESGELDTADGVRNQATTLIGAPGARAAFTQFFQEMMDHSELDHLGKDSTTFPTFDAALTTSMRGELGRLVEEQAFDSTGGDFRDIFDADHTFVDAKLAALYEITPPTSGWARVALRTDQPRTGIFGQASFLALKAHPVNTSPTLRGKMIRERFLCEPVGAPPPDVDTNIPSSPAGQNLTLRQRMGLHVTAANCAGCHKQMDPLGFPFENFDAIGRFRTTDNGQPVDASGSLDKALFTDAKGLAAALKADKRVARCLTKSLYRQGAGHAEIYSETAPLRAAETAFIDSGYQMRFLLVELAASDAFRYGKAVAP